MQQLWPQPGDAHATARAADSAKCNVWQLLSSSAFHAHAHALPSAAAEQPKWSNGNASPAAAEANETGPGSHRSYSDAVEPRLRRKGNAGKQMCEQQRLQSADEGPRSKCLPASRHQRDNANRNCKWLSRSRSFASLSPWLLCHER